MHDKCLTVEECFYGSATLGERGQIVIPAEARKDCDIHSGDKLLVFRHPLHPHMIFMAKLGDMQEFFQQITRSLEQMNDQLAKAIAVAEEEGA